MAPCELQARRSKAGLPRSRPPERRALSDAYAARCRADSRLAVQGHRPAVVILLTGWNSRALPQDQGSHYQGLPGRRGRRPRRRLEPLPATRRDCPDHRDLAAQPGRGYRAGRGYNRDPPTRSTPNGRGYSRDLRNSRDPPGQPSRGSRGSRGYHKPGSGCRRTGRQCGAGAG
jgi:hypothetical protein